MGGAEMSSGEESIVGIQAASSESKEIPRKWHKDVTPKVVQWWQALPVAKEGPAQRPAK